LFSSVLVISLLGSFGTVISADPYETEAPEVPDGYEIVKEYSASGTPVNDSRVQVVTDNQIHNLQSDVNTKGNMKVIKNETRPFRELKSLTAEDTITQFVTEVEIMAFMEDNQTDPTGVVTTYATIYWSEYNQKMYIGMDKAYTRWEQAASFNTSSKATGRVIQNGPLYGSGVATGQIRDFNEIPVTYGQAILWDVSKYNWKPVLGSGLLTQVGISYVTSIRGRTSVTDFPFAVMIYGEIPTFP
jgi:hypothetical protein